MGIIEGRTSSFARSEGAFEKEVAPACPPKG
jgi:hypothetical protein